MPVYRKRLPLPSGRDAHAFGLRNERRFVAWFGGLLGGEGVPEWVVGVRHATPEEDARGIDVWVKTDVGDVPVQIKSSHRDAASFVSKPRDIEIICVVFAPSIRPHVVKAFLVSRLSTHRNKQLAIRQESIEVVA